MFKLIKGAHVYNPNYIGKQDLLISSGKITKIEDNINIDSEQFNVEIIEAQDKILTPGLIDQHVHLLGGGGEGGFHTRTPEIVLSDIVKSGVTTVLGLLGTDGTTRSLEALLAKARGLENEGISSYILTGSYEIPSPTLTGNVKRDIILIDKVIGTKMALSDHRSSWPTEDEIIKAVSNNRVGGMLSSKPGILVLHMGDYKDKLDLIFKVLDDTNIPIKHFLPTHVNRDKSLFNDAIRFTKRGGIIDLTSGIVPTEGNNKSIKPSIAVKECLLKGVPISNITMSSDSNGSKPFYNKKGELVKMGVGTMDTLLNEVRDMVNEEGIDISQAIRLVTSNVASVLGISSFKGRIERGYDADILLMDKDLEIDTVIAKGKKVVENKEVLVRGTYE